MTATIRKLTDEDMGDILEISRHVWEGHDYLPSTAKEWLHDPNCNFCGVEVDNHIVAVGNLRLLEDGHTGWLEGLRVHPDHRGKGFANDITTFFVQKAADLRLRRLRYTTSTENAASLKLAKMARFKKVLTMAVLWHDKPRPLDRIHGYPPIRKKEPENVWNLLRTDQHIVPRGILFYDWKAADITCSSIKNLGKTHEFFLAVKNKRVDSLSLGSSGQNLNQTWRGFTVYATDSDGFTSQLSCNLAIASKQGQSSISCTFEPKFEKTLDKLDLTEGRDGTHLVLFEKNITAKNPKR